MHHPVLFKVADILKVTCCVKDRSYYISLSNDIALTSTLSITDVELKLKNTAQCSNEKSSMCLTDAVFFQMMKQYLLNVVNGGSKKSH